jgi:putative peptidoglycan lipid II flippase
MIAAVLLPIAVFAVFLRFPIFQIFLERGEFTSQNTSEVSSVFLYLSLSMIGSGFGQMIAGAYCVLRKVRLLLILSLFGLILNILLSAILHGVMGVEGLALATGIATFLGCVLNLAILNREIGGLDVIYLAKFMVKTFLGAFIGGIGMATISISGALGESGSFEPDRQAGDIRSCLGNNLYVNDEFFQNG